ncbi:MAG: PaaI family thioesterase [Actinomycetota bacterium]
MVDEVAAQTRKRIEGDSYANTLGAELLELRQGWARVRLRLGPGHLNFMGMIHGGVIFSLADVAFGAAANSFGTRAMALSVGIDFLAAPPQQGELYAEVELIKRAGKMGFYRMVVSSADGGEVARCHGWAYHTGKPLEEEV